MLPLLPNTNKLDYSKYNFWRVEFDLIKNQTTSITGKWIKSVSSDNKLKIFLETNMISQCILEFAKKEVHIYSIGGNVIPIYARVIENKLILSNVAHLLIIPKEKIRICSTILAQQIVGSNFPQNNIFIDLNLLDASAHYKIKNRKIIYVGTLLASANISKYDDAKKYIMDFYDKLFNNGKPIIVLLSGGYDSRLNLAIANHFSKKYDNKIYCFHEEKPIQSEKHIVDKIKDLMEIELEIIPRDHFSKGTDDILFDDYHSLLHSGSYRENLPRWHKFFQYILKKHPDGILVGFGAEAHKGKYYEKVHHLNSQSQREFGSYQKTLYKIVKFLGIKNFQKNSEKLFFEDLVLKSKELKNKYSKIDFVHYHTYIVNGYAHRCHNLFQGFNLSFPLLDIEFLKIIFAMDFREKQGFEIVKRLLNELEPELSKIPFSSGNISSLKRVNPILSLLKSWLSKFIRKPYIPITTRKGIQQLTNSQKEYISNLGAIKSPELQKIRNLLLTDCQEMKEIRLDCLLILFNYMYLLESKYSIHLSFE